MAKQDKIEIFVVLDTGRSELRYIGARVKQGAATGHGWSVTDIHNQIYRLPGQPGKRPRPEGLLPLFAWACLQLPPVTKVKAEDYIREIVGNSLSCRNRWIKKEKRFSEGRTDPLYDRMGCFHIQYRLLSRIFGWRNTISLSDKSPISAADIHICDLGQLKIRLGIKIDETLLRRLRRVSARTLEKCPVDEKLLCRCMADFSGLANITTEEIWRAFTRLKGSREDRKQLSKSRPPSLQKPIQKYKKRIVDNWQTLWFSHLDPRETSAPYLDRTVIPENEAARRKYSGPQKLAELIAKENAIILLGDPGSGKSYTTARLAVACANGELLEGYFPIYTSLSRLHEATPIKSLYTQAIGKVLGTEELKHGGQLYEDLLKSNTKIIFIVDAFDQGSAEQRSILKDGLLAHALCRGNKLIVTCRRYEYGNEFELIPTFCLAPLSEKQAIRYFRHFVTLPVSRVFEFRIQYGERAYRIARDPFLLSKTGIMLAAEQEAGLPHNPGQLLDMFIERCPSFKVAETSGIESLDADLHDQKNLLLELIAYTVIDCLDPETGCTLKDLRPPLSSWHSKFSMKRLLKQAFRDRLLKKGAYLHTGGEIEFAHELFKEALAARHLRRLLVGKQTEEKKRILFEHMDCVKWDSVLVLLVGMLDERDCRLAMNLLVEYVPSLAARCYTAASCQDAGLEQSVVDSLLSRHEQLGTSTLGNLLEEMGTDQAVNALLDPTSPCYSRFTSRISSAMLEYENALSPEPVPIPSKSTLVEQEEALHRKLIQAANLPRGDAISLLLGAYREQEEQKAKSPEEIRFVYVLRRLRIFAELRDLEDDISFDPFMDILKSCHLLSDLASRILGTALEYESAETIAKCVVCLRKAGLEFYPARHALLTLAETMASGPAGVLRTCPQDIGRVYLHYKDTDRFFSIMVSQRSRAIRELLCSPDEDKQNAASEALFMFPPAEFTHDLEERLGASSSSQAKIYIAGALLKTASARRGEAVSVLSDALRRNDTDAWRLAVRVLGDVQTAESRSLLSSNLQRCGQDRQMASEILEALKRPETDEECSLFAGLYECCKDDNVRSSIIRALCRSPRPDVIQHLLVILRKCRLEDCGLIWERLARFPTERMFEVLSLEVITNVLNLLRLDLYDLENGKGIPLNQLAAALCNAGRALRPRALEIIEKTLGRPLDDLLWLWRERTRLLLCTWLADKIGIVLGVRWEINKDEGETLIREATERLIREAPYGLLYLGLFPFVRGVERLTGRRFLHILHPHFQRLRKATDFSENAGKNSRGSKKEPKKEKPISA